MKIGYARVSVKDETLTLQIDALNKAGCDEIFKDRNHGEHEELKKALNKVKSGDTFIVPRLSSCSQNVKELHSIIEELNTKGVSFKTIEQDLDTSTETGKLMFGFLSTISEFEKDLQAERQAIGIKAAQAKGTKFGRKAIFDEEKTAQAIELQKKGLKNQEIADTFGIARSTLLRYIANYKKTPDWGEFPLNKKKKRNFWGRKNYPLKVTLYKKSKNIKYYNSDPKTNSIHFDRVTLQFGTKKNNWFYTFIHEVRINPNTGDEILEELYSIVEELYPPNKDEIESRLLPYLDKLYYMTPKVIDKATKQYEKENKHLRDNQKEVDYSSWDFSYPFNPFPSDYKESLVSSIEKVEAPVDETSTEKKDESDIYLGIFEELGIEKPNQG